MDLNLFRREDEKYSELWRDNYKDAHWRRLANALAGCAAKGESVIDFGFGRGTALDFFEEKGLAIAGVDVSSFAVGQQRMRNRRVFHASLDDMVEIPAGAFDFGFCNDVLEHVPPESVEGALSEIRRICRRMLFVSVCPTASHHLSPTGENLHLTVRSEDWWREQFEKLGGVTKLRFWFSRSVRFVVDFS